MNSVYDEYMKRFPHSISVIAINFDDEEFMIELTDLMTKALETGKPLTDDIFNFPDGAWY